ncbi:MAG: PAS domain-containing protein [Campylobacterales bacterium]|nr:PAS domain-containing protein [Campylobacterales bacterium]
MSNITPIDQEFVYDGSVLISQTDVNGVITYVNQEFCKISGYSVDELVGKGHEIIRHPDMPKTVFKKMWERIQSGQSWSGLIKNLRKDGLYYWVECEVLPIIDQKGFITGYITAQKPSPRKNISENEQSYKKLLEKEQRL